MRWKVSLIHEFLQLPPTDRALLIRAAAALGAIRMCLWVIPYRLLRGVLGAATRRKIRSRGAQDSPERIAWAVTVASRYVPSTATCLLRALAAHLLLARSGNVARIRIGVRRDAEGSFEAHAWVESEGRILVGAQTDPSRFVPLSPMRGKASQRGRPGSLPDRCPSLVALRKLRRVATNREHGIR